MIIIAACNNDQVLKANLLASDDVAAGRITVLPQRGFKCAGMAYNTGLKQTVAPIVAFVHQDVYLPIGWLGRVMSQIAELEKKDPNWAVIGVWGICPDGRYSGRVWCTGGGREHVGQITETTEAASIDEIVIIVNNRHQLSFDESLPGYHLYATDIIRTARSKGLRSYIITAPVVHNSRKNPRPLDKHYFAAYRYMQRKWSAELPLLTAVVPVTRTGWPLYRQWAKNEYNIIRGRRRFGGQDEDAIAIARQLGYESRAV